MYNSEFWTNRRCKLCVFGRVFGHHVLVIHSLPSIITQNLIKTTLLIFVKYILVFRKELGVVDMQREHLGWFPKKSW